MPQPHQLQALRVYQRQQARSPLGKLYPSSLLNHLIGLQWHHALARGWAEPQETPSRFFSNFLSQNTSSYSQIYFP